MKIQFDTIKQPKQSQELAQPMMGKKAQAAYGAAESQSIGFFPQESQIGHSVLSQIGEGEDFVSAKDQVALQRDYMTVMSNTMSEKDFSKMQQEGYDAFSYDPEESVTILDKIKTELAKSGEEIIGFNDDLSVEELSAAAGSDGVGRALASKLEQANVPSTKENVQNLEEAARKVEALDSLPEGAYVYMMEHHLAPTVDNLYQAQFSGYASKEGMAPAAFATGSYNRIGQGSMQYRQEEAVSISPAMESQIKERMESWGVEASEEGLQDCQWLLNHGLELSKENLEQYKALKDLPLPMDAETYVNHAIAHMALGEEPGKIPFSQLERDFVAEAIAIEARYEKITPETLDYVASKELPLTLETLEQYQGKTEAGLENIRARRQLEEVRLHMSAQANLKLLQSGVSIDTEPMETLIEQLKAAETKIFEAIYGAKDPAQGQIANRLVETTLQVSLELASMPASLAGKIPWMEQPTLQSVHAEGALLQKRFEAAGESYEALMTAPRRDMGDSIGKAFQNVDAILREMALEPTEENEKVIRILGHNQLEINAENFEKVAKAEGQITSILNALKPGTVLSMVREGKNPLTMGLEEMDQYLKEKNASFENQTESYSKFLYQLEQKKDITEEERSAYIGIYRLIHQIEKNDSAAVGAVVSAGVDLNFSNLLAMARSKRFGSTDVKIDDTNSHKVKVVRAEDSISAQIFKGIAKPEALLENMVSMEEDPALEEAYQKEEFARYQEILNANKDQAEYLKQYNQPVTVDFLEAAGVLTRKRGKLSRDLTALEEKIEKSLEKGSFLEAGKEVVASLDQEDARKAAYENVIQAGEEILQKALETPVEGQTYLDIKAMQSLQKQLRLCSNMAAEENYEIPMEVEGQVLSVNLKIYHHSNNPAEAKITFASDVYGQVEARFGLYPEGLRGTIATDSVEGKEALENRKEDFVKKCKEMVAEDFKVADIYIDSKGKMDLNRVEAKDMPSKDASGLYKVAKAFLSSI